MTARPGRIRELIPIDLPRPRDITSPRFNDIKRHILSLLRPERAAAGPLAME
jgi:NitT/TauT family transport system ATP-binding protein